MPRTICFAALFIICIGTVRGQSYQQGKILKWDTEPYSQNAHILRNGVVYYVQIDRTVYQITRRTTKPDTNLVAGQGVRCRVEKDRMFISAENGKETKYAIIGASAED